MEIYIKKIQKLENQDSKLKAFVDINIDGQITIKGLSLILDNNNQYFVAYPKQLNPKNNNRYDIIFIDNLDLKKEIENKIIEIYNKY